MATKAKKAAAKPVIFPRKAVPLYCPPGASKEKQMQVQAQLVTSSDFAAYRVINGVEAKSGAELIDVPALMRQLRDEAKAVNSGDMKQAEAMLVNQATALQSLFSRLAERGMGCTDAVPFEINMRMALRAQNQCRATLETLATIKNPPVMFAKQANVTTGPQQINNGIASSPARETENLQNKLLEAQDGEWLDTRTEGATGKADSELATVGKVHRAKNGKG